jgi:hypothetical protein
MKGRTQTALVAILLAVLIPVAVLVVVSLIPPPELTMDEIKRMEEKQGKNVDDVKRWEEKHGKPKSR